MSGPADLSSFAELAPSASDSSAPGISRAPVPFLKWPGGKRQLLPLLRAGAPQGFHRYIEPFLGGGALLFDLHDHPGACIAADINPELVTVYNQVKNNVDELLVELEQAAQRLSEADFYEMRASRPDTDVACAVRTLYLNRTCFNGMYRQNRAGEFNVPWGGEHKKDAVYRAEPIREASARLQTVTISVSDFAQTMASAQEGDWIYVDPPYAPLSPTASFAQYSKDGFNKADHERLAAAIREAGERGVYVMLSNSNTALTTEIYGDCVELYPVNVRRNVGAAAHTRKSVQEVIGVNYDPTQMADSALFLKGTLNQSEVVSAPTPPSQ